MSSGNPLLGERLLEQTFDRSSGMTIKGTSNRLAMLLAMTMITAGWSWQRFLVAPDQAMLWALGGGVTALVMVLVLMFKRELAPYLAPPYALAKGLLIGAVSAHYEARFGGIVFQAVLLTFGVTAAMLFAYMTGIVRATPALVRGVVAATVGIGLYYLVALILQAFGWPAPLIHDSGPLGIGFSLLVLGVAAFNLVIDFAEIENAAQDGMPKYMEWYGAFALLVTLLWLYIEALRFLSKLRD